MTRRGMSRRAALAAAAGASAVATAAKAQGAPRTYLVVHGAWSSAWAWKRMRPLLTRGGSQLFIPSLTGLGERAHLAGPDVSLETHIADVQGVLEMEDLSDVTLIAHSYGGMVGTGVADRSRKRIRRLIYLDAFVPENGQSLTAITGRPQRGDDWRVPANPLPPDTAAADVAWMLPRRTPQPAKTFTTPLAISSDANLPPRAYIRCTRTADPDFFGQMYHRAKARGWPVREIDSSHNPHVTVPDRLAVLIDELCGAT
jgi:pimeloyl-ACP methyl ester carboxylesterase